MEVKVRPTFIQSLLAGGAAGTAVDLLFFPVDTMKTRLQSAKGFRRAGGFHGVYKGVGSVVVGSAPGAAVFFSSYETMKKILPFSDRLAPVNHMISASVAEVVRMFPYIFRSAIPFSRLPSLVMHTLPGCLFDSCAD